jgi:quinol-cytochrome oxidoreductase complex cytochrome b subunit
MRGFFERRGREGYAEYAEKKYEKNTKLNSKSDWKLINLLLQIAVFFLKFWFYFLFSAPFAKPSRPLRSKNPRISPVQRDPRIKQHPQGAKF